MKPFPKVAFWFAVAAQLLALGGMIAQREWLLHTGQVIRLKCAPIDPRSLLSGDYVRLNYDISNMRAENMAVLNPNNETFNKHDTVYVALKQSSDSPFWNAAEMSHDRQRLKAVHPVVMRGVMESSWNAQVRYGVEQYFVPQFEGLELEQELRDVSVEVAVGDSGASAIKRLFLQDREVRFY